MDQERPGEVGLTRPGGPRPTAGPGHVRFTSGLIVPRCDTSEMMDVTFAFSLRSGLFR